MKKIMLYNELTHDFSGLSEFQSCNNGKTKQYNIPSPFTVEELKEISSGLALNIVQGQKFVNWASGKFAEELNAELHFCQNLRNKVDELIRLNDRG